MILDLAVLNFALGIFDTWLTQKRIREYGESVELNGLIRKLSTLMGPQLGSVVGVLVPVAMWTYLAVYFDLPVALALLVGFNIKRFEIQVASLLFERQAKNIKKMIDDYHKIAGGEATLPSDSNESQPPACSSKYTPTDCK
jgi:hypothetical protein